MEKIVAKIYKINPIHTGNTESLAFIDRIVKTHNEKSDKFFKRIPCMENASDFFQLELFVHVPLPNKKPSWNGMVNEITGQHPGLKPIESKNPSFILFFIAEDEIFVVCGGGGIWVIEAYIDTQFGFQVVECLIDPNKSDLRTVSKIGLFGIELMSSSSFRGNYVLTDDDSFGKHYKGVDVFIDKNKLKQIGISTDKTKLLVRGEIGFKIDNKVSFKEIEDRINQIRLLLAKGSDIELNPFRQLGRQDLKCEIGDKEFGEVLDDKLLEVFFNEFDQHPEIYHPNLTAFLSSSTLMFKYEKREPVKIESWQRFSLKLIFRKIGLDVDSINFPRFSKYLKNISTAIINEENGSLEYRRPLEEWLHGEITLDQKKYMKLENNWCTFSENYQNQITKRVEDLFQKIKVQRVIPWSTDFQNEGCYNEALGKQGSFLVADEEYHERIELADVIEFAENELVIYHFKMDFNRNIRVLSNQLINSARIITDFRNPDKEAELKAYFEKVISKNEEEKDDNVNYDKFKALIQAGSVRFVFGIITKTNTLSDEELQTELMTAKSTIAKMSLLNTYYRIKEQDFQFSISKVSRS